MSDEPTPDQGQPIPREFHSEYEDRPFRTCSRCGESLDAFAVYQINKSWRNGECVFEFVFCEPCRDRMIEEFSVESKSRLMKHEQENLSDIRGTTQCAFCGTSREDVPMRDYIITAVCHTDRMLDSIMICETCHLKTHDLLSEKTRDVRRRFIEDLPGVPPDWEGLPIEEDAIHFANAKGTPARSPALSGLHSRRQPHIARHHGDPLFLPITEMLWYGRKFNPDR